MQGYLAALHFVLTGLLIVLRNKGALDPGEIDAILEASSAKLADKIEAMVKNAPKFASQSMRMKAARDAVLAVIRGDLTTAPPE